LVDHSSLVTVSIARAHTSSDKGVSLGVGEGCFSTVCHSPTFGIDQSETPDFAPDSRPPLLFADKLSLLHPRSISCWKSISTPSALGSQSFLLIAQRLHALADRLEILGILGSQSVSISDLAISFDTSEIQAESPASVSSNTVYLMRDFCNGVIPSANNTAVTLK
jgi:hypothetical protein